MIEVVVTDSKGVVATATADIPQDAILAARTLKTDARQAVQLQGYHRTLTAAYYVDGQLISSGQ